MSYVGKLEAHMYSYLLLAHPGETTNNKEHQRQDKQV